MPNNAHFGPELFDFLRALKRHNNRDWFANNKDRYETVVRAPALQFISSFAPHLHKLSPYFRADAHPTRGSLFRIYRDTRFSPDKRPYKTHVGIHFTYTGPKDVHAPAFYLHFEPDNCFVAAGLWRPDSRALTAVRGAIARDSAQWDKIRRKLEIEGDTLTRPPRGYDPNHPFISDIKRKDFLTSIVFTDSQVCTPKFLPDFVKACRKMSPLVEFTTTAMGLKF